MDKVLSEKEEAVAIWRQIEALSRELETPDSALTHFIRVSCTYGRIKFEVIQHGWAVMLMGLKGERSGRYDHDAISKHIAAYDLAWVEWKALFAGNPDCPTLYRDVYFMGDKPGLGASVNKYRKLIEANTKL